jgi:hypothetical protein
MNNWCNCWLFTHILLGILIFKGLTARRLHKSFGVKRLKDLLHSTQYFTIDVVLWETRIAVERGTKNSSNNLISTTGVGRNKIPLELLTVWILFV